MFTREELLHSVWGLGTYARTRTLDSHVISSTVSGVVCVGCGFCPGCRRRFISSGVVSALAAELSPKGEATWRGRCAPFDTPLVTIDPALASSHIAHRVVLPDGREAWTVLDVSGAEVGSVSAFLRYLHRIERSPNTVRAYTHDLKLFCEFLAGRGLGWDAVGVADLGDFAAWLRRPAPNVVPLRGVRPARSPATTRSVSTPCPHFLTDERYRPVLEEQLTRAEQRIADAERAGHQRLAEINRPDVLDLRRIIAGLDRLGE